MKQEMSTWFSIAVKILGFLEDIFVDERLGELFENDTVSRYFFRDTSAAVAATATLQTFSHEENRTIGGGEDVQQMISSSFSLSGDSSILRGYLRDHSSEWDAKKVFILCELLLLDSIELKSKIVDLIF